jgi:hypothetical protein
MREQGWQTKNKNRKQNRGQGVGNNIIIQHL